MKALIFDVDGTLWDSRQAVAESWEELLFRETGQHRGFTAENISYLFGKPMNEISACLFPELPPDRQLEMGQKCFLYENEYLASHPGELFPGVADTLKKLSLSYPLYIVSNCQSGYIEVFLQGPALARSLKAISVMEIHTPQKDRRSGVSWNFTVWMTRSTSGIPRVT